MLCLGFPPQDENLPSTHSQRESWQVSSQKPPGHFLSLTPTSNQSQIPLVLPQKYLQSPLPWTSTASMGTLAISHPGPRLCLITNSPLSVHPPSPARGTGLQIKPYGDYRSFGKWGFIYPKGQCQRSPVGQAKPLRSCFLSNLTSHISAHMDPHSSPSYFSPSTLRARLPMPSSLCRRSSLPNQLLFILQQPVPHSPPLRSIFGCRENWTLPPLYSHRPLAKNVFICSK